MPDFFEKLGVHELCAFIAFLKYGLVHRDGYNLGFLQKIKH